METTHEGGFSTEGASNDVLNAILLSVSGALFVVDCDWHYICVNDYVLVQAGMQRADILGKIIWEIFPDLLGTKFYTELHRAVAQQSIIQFEYFYPKWQRWYENRVCPFAGGIAVTAIDITDRKQIEDKIQQNQAKFRRLANANIIGMLSANMEQIIDANDAFLQMVGYTREDLEAGRLRWHDMTPPEYWDADARGIEEVLRQGFCTPFEKEYICKDGSRVFILIGGAMLEPEPPSFVCFVLNLTQHKRAEEALRESEARLQLAFKTGRIGSWDWNLKTRQVTWSDGHFTVLGLQPGECEPSYKTWLSSVHPDDVAGAEAALQQAKQEKIEFHHEYRTVWKDGSIRWTEARGQFFYDADGQPDRMIGVIVDITERKQAEQERERLLEQERATREAAEMANRIKDEFLAVLSHELRSPLNPILGWTKLLQSRQLDEATMQRGFEVIERNTRLQAQLIEDLLDVSRILRGKLSLHLHPVNLITVIEGALETVQVPATIKSIQIHTQLDSSVEYVLGDPSRLQQVVWNLLSNAVKFTPANGQIHVRLEQVEGNQDITLSHASHTSSVPYVASFHSYAQITVSDTGKGINPEFLPHVFDYFRQADSSITRNFGGLGLGLAIVRHLVELHGGIVWATSPGEGQGATFTIRLPISPLVQHAIPQNQAIAQDTNLAGIHVLAVDDQADMRDYIALALQQAGATVTVVASAQDVFDALNQALPDLLLADIGMPDLDGYELLHQIRQRSPAQGGLLPAIALTAYAGESDRQQALAAGFHIHLPKPIDPDTLIHSILTLVKKH